MVNTVVSTAQDWDGNARTRVDMGGDNDKFVSDQRASLSVSWEGDGWGIHVGGNANYTLSDSQEDVEMSWDEVYASTDIMGYASVAVGRMALEYGGGQLIGANDWGTRPQTRDGGVFTIANDMMDLDFGLYRNNDGTCDTCDTENNYFFNASKSEGDWSVNLTYVSNNDESSAMGLDLGYAMMDGGLDLAVSYNTASDGDESTEDMDYMSIGGTYHVNDDMSVSGTRTTYGDGGFGWSGSNMDGSWASHGNMGYLSANDEDLALGVSYSMGDFNLGVTMHKVTNSENEDYERNVTEANLSYSMSDNANVSIKYATDGDDDEADDDKYMWLTLTITP